MWKKISGAAVLLAALLGRVGDVDFIVTRIDDPGWMGDAANAVTHQPIWLTIVFICVGLGLIFWWSRSHPKSVDSALHGRLGPESDAPRDEIILKTEPHDWNLSQAYQYWAVSTNEQGDFGNELEEAANKSVVTIWGKRGFLENAIMEAISPSHWIKSCIDMHPVIFSSTTGVDEAYILENSTTAPRQHYDPNDFEYWKLKVTSEEIKKLWPKADT